jgi:hypothetical protein
LAKNVKFTYRHKPAAAPAHPGSNRIGKQHRPFGEPVAYLKGTPQFEAVPFDPPQGELVLPLSTIAPDVSKSVTAAKQLVFHCVGDTGGVYGTSAQAAVAKEMEAQIKNPGASGSPAFFYHLGDVVYFNGISTDYPEQFYEPYQYYPAEIFAIPGNHDGSTHVMGKDPVVNPPYMVSRSTSAIQPARPPAATSGL